MSHYHTPDECREGCGPLTTDDDGIATCAVCAGEASDALDEFDARKKTEKAFADLDKALQPYREQALREMRKLAEKNCDRDRRAQHRAS